MYIYIHIYIYIYIYTYIYIYIYWCHMVTKHAGSFTSSSPMSLPSDTSACLLQGFLRHASRKPTILNRKIIELPWNPTGSVRSSYDNAFFSTKKNVFQFVSCSDLDSYTSWCTLLCLLVDDLPPTWSGSQWDLDDLGVLPWPKKPSHTHSPVNVAAVVQIWQS